MASMGHTFSSFHNANPPKFEPNKSFSIRMILDIPEESAEARALSSSNSSSVESCPVPRLTLVPRAAGTMVHHHAYNVPPSNLMNLQDFGVVPYACHWCYGDLPFRNRDFSFDRIFSKKRRRRPMQKRKQRPVFSPHQIQAMEKEFAKQRYISKDNRARLALEIKLTEPQVKSWFKNRRTKWKKETKDEESPTSRCSQGEIKQVLIAVSGTNPFHQSICANSLVNPFGALRQYCAAPLFSTFDFKGSFIA